VGPGCQREEAAREGGGEALTGGAQVSAGGSRARVGPPGPGREGGECGRARVGLEIGPAEGGGEVFLFLFLFLIIIPFFSFFLFLFLFYSFSLETKNIF
jgi:hypothetical protein